MKTTLLTLFSLIILVSSYGQTPTQTYPKVAGYVGILHPIGTWSSAGTDTNFGDHYVLGMPTGINIWKSAKIGFSAEFVPFIRAENGNSKMANFIFHPGVLVA
ncbi:hypothetical protein [Mucilaginibacter pallidiroseus]|uniref:hypothetical protein n=1 Tax=Mucilaginibacter pallidiroseus TaxID=2599295 RepID=UPI001C943C8A|nr:hypothetical protein [Mucilaginibacter pallidiroseus]